MSLHARIKAAVDELVIGDLGLTEVLRTQFPECTTGDVDPMAYQALRDALKTFLEGWYDGNRPPTRQERWNAANDEFNASAGPSERAHEQWLLVERPSNGGRVRCFTSHASQAMLTAYSLMQDEWLPVVAIDLDTGDRFEPARALNWVPAGGKEG